MIDFDLILQNDKILLRPTIEEDIEGFSQLTNDTKRWYFFTSDLSNRLELENWVNDSLIQRQKQLRLPFTIIDKSNNGIIGATSFGNISYIDQRIEIGWTWISTHYQGKGMNDQMKYLMIDYCFEVSDFLRVEIKTDVLNVFARGALKRINMTEEGVLRSHTLMTNNRRRDTIYYSVLKSEWNDIKIKNNWLK